jgi:hypothetical protein
LRTPYQEYITNVLAGGEGAAGERHRDWGSNELKLTQIDQERETLPVTSDQKGALSIARRRKR